MARLRVATPSADVTESYPRSYDNDRGCGSPADFDSLFGSSPNPSIIADDADAHQRTLRRDQPNLAPARLPLLQLCDWDPELDYDERPPTCIHYSIEWKLTLRNRKVSKDTEQNVVLAPGAFWRTTLRDKVEKLAMKKFQSSTIPDDTVVTVSVSDRAERDLVKRYDELDIEWDVVEEQLVRWSGLFRAGKKLRIDVTFSYKEGGRGGGRSPARGGRLGGRSVSRRMLEDRDAQLDAEETSTGHPPAWRDVYSLMRCPGAPCQHGTHCWRDEGGTKHYKLNTHHLRELVKFVEGGGVLLTHEDVPHGIRQQLYAEADRDARRQGKSKEVSAAVGPPITITNVLPSAWNGNANTVAVTGSETTQDSTIGARLQVKLDIPGPRDVALKQYSAWQCSQVQHEELKKEYRKACSVAMADGLDLEQLHEDQDADFLIEKGVKRGIARRFIRDIGRWAAHQQSGEVPS